MGAISAVFLLLAGAGVVFASPAAKPRAVVATSAPTAVPEPESFSAEMPSKTVSGFRMEGAPEIEVVFGDIEHFKGHINRLYSLSAEMATARREFAAATHRAQKILIQSKGCPAELVAADYHRASESGISYRRLGARFESVYFAVRTLHELGETSGLTPDYRWKVNKADSLYRLALADLREMRAVFTGQLEKDLRTHGCRLQELLTEGQRLAAEQKPSTDLPVLATVTPPSKKKNILEPAEVVPAPTATFFVSNEKCSDRLRVHVDGTMLGEVAPGTRAAFQSLAGRRVICLLGADEHKTCGASGTLRTAFVYDGWAITRHCENKPATR